MGTFWKRRLLDAYVANPLKLFRIFSDHHEHSQIPSNPSPSSQASSHPNLQIFSMTFSQVFLHNSRAIAWRLSKKIASTWTDFQTCRVCQVLNISQKPWQYLRYNHQEGPCWEDTMFRIHMWKRHLRKRHILWGHVLRGTCWGNTCGEHTCWDNTC